MARLDLVGITKDFGPTKVLRGIDLVVNDGEFVAFVGPSGCGKSTLLRLICGLDEVTSGTIAVDGEDVNNVPPSKRGIAMVFQSYALYPHMSVAANMGYALKLAGMPKAEIAQRVAKAAGILRIDPYLDRKPRQLSGGQRQRVAIGRAIVREPKIFLFDEPLSNLDAALRVEMRLEIARMKQRLGTTMIYVTHDQIEAMTLADKIVVLNGGQVEQVGSPLELYETPANRFVAAFIGSPRMNMLPVNGVGEGHFVVPGGRLDCRMRHFGPQATTIGLRPEHLTLTAPDKDNLTGQVTMTEHLGSDTYAYITLAADTIVVARLPGERLVQAGETVGLSIDPARLYAFDADGRSLMAERAEALSAA